MSKSVTYAGAKIFDGTKLHKDSSLVITEGTVNSLNDADGSVAGTQNLEGGFLIPGFIDLQVNGGGGCLFNDDPSLKAIETICAAHAKLGTTALMPTLITDTTERTRCAVDAVLNAQAREVPGFFGLHLEGPHLSIPKKGAHDPSLIRKMSSCDMDLLIDAASKIKNLMITVAPESVSSDQITALRKAGATISLGHSNTSYDSALAAAKAGASCVTHLYNAMSPLTHREPGLVGAALNCGGLSCGIIADGFHVHPAALKIAIRSKQGPGKVFLVSDAMSVTGTDKECFTLGGRKILRRAGRLTLEDGTLAGADLDMATAFRYLINIVGIDLAEASRMASRYPAGVMKQTRRYGRLVPGSVADMIHLDDDLNIKQVWQAGNPLL